MSYAQVLRQSASNFLRSLGILSALFLVPGASFAQSAQTTPPADYAITQELNKYPGLPAELGQLFTKLQQNVTFPAPRTESRILPLLPPGTVAYVALPNYGGVASQSTKIFRQELQDSPVLRDWWTHSTFTATSGPKILAALDQFSDLHQFLGDELVLSAAMDVQEPTFLLVAEVRKPGLKPFLRQLALQISGNPTSPMRVIDQAELATATERPHAQEPIILVRPDFVVLSLDLNTLRAFNAQLNSPKPEFASTPFGRRLLQEYQDGVTMLEAGNVHAILDKTLPALKNSAAFQQSGFAEMQYLVADHKSISGKSFSQMELSFSAPRHGAASWLAKPTSLGSLDFVSPKSLFVTTFVLSNPAQIFDDAKALATLTHPNSFAAVPMLEQSMNLSLKDDLLSLLDGELTVELDSLTPPHPVWKASLAVKDADHLKKSLNTILTVAHIQPEQSEDAGITYTTIKIPAANNPTSFTYAFLDGYLLLASSRGALAESVQLHRSGGSLAKSPKFLAAFPPTHPLEASAVLYENPLAVSALQMQALMPDLAHALTQSSSDTAPLVVTVFGENSSIREMSNNPAFDAAGVLIVAAIAIPNLLRSRIAANEASAIGSVRTVNTAQVTYAATYPKRGFAPNLASLGFDPSRPGLSSPDRAGIIAEPLANPSCTAGAWCTKSGYEFQVTSLCKLQPCMNFLVLATPVSTATGTRSFCSTSDGIIRFKLGDPLTAPITIADCKSWTPLQ